MRRVFVIGTVEEPKNDAPQPQQGAGASVINTSDLAGDIKKIENKFVASAQLQVKIFLSASDFNQNNVNTTVTTLVQSEQRIKEENDFKAFYARTFNEEFDSANDMSFLKKLIAAIYLGNGFMKK